VEFLKIKPSHKERPKHTNATNFALTAGLKRFCSLETACVFCHNQPAICGSCRTKKAIARISHWKMMNKAGRAIIKHIKNKSQQKVNYFSVDSSILYMTS
jgi:hypothetical protein